jgi:cytoplasmic iron level regulating protein YaaA (DUF328/UPF0246 family)
MKRTPLFLVACVSKKRSKLSPARDLYSSDWFLKARAYVEQQRGRWFILSAKYGLVDPKTIIRPYNLTLANQNVVQRRRWAEAVELQLKRVIRRGDRVVFLAGSLYREPLVPTVRSLGARVEEPLRKLGIGQQKAWFKRRLLNRA